MPLLKPGTTGSSPGLWRVRQVASKDVSVTRTDRKRPIDLRQRLHELLVLPKTLLTNCRIGGKRAIVEWDSRTDRRPRLI
jgi:hypothetical protein